MFCSTQFQVTSTVMSDTAPVVLPAYNQPGLVKSYPLFNPGTKASQSV